MRTTIGIIFGVLILVTGPARSMPESSERAPCPYTCTAGIPGYEGCVKRIAAMNCDDSAEAESGDERWAPGRRDKGMHPSMKGMPPPMLGMEEEGFKDEGMPQPMPGMDEDGNPCKMGGTYYSGPCADYQAEQDEGMPPPMLGMEEEGFKDEGMPPPMLGMEEGFKEDSTNLRDINGDEVTGPVNIAYKRISREIGERTGSECDRWCYYGANDKGCMTKEEKRRSPDYCPSCRESASLMGQDMMHEQCIAESIENGGVFNCPEKPDVCNEEYCQESRDVNGCTRWHYVPVLCGGAGRQCYDKFLRPMCCDANGNGESCAYLGTAKYRDDPVCNEVGRQDVNE